MELVSKIIAFISEYQELALVVIVPLLDFLLRKVKTKKPLSIIDKCLDVLGYALFVFGLGPIEKLVKKLREILNRAVPERLK